MSPPGPKKSLFPLKNYNPSERLEVGVGDAITGQKRAGFAFNLSRLIINKYYLLNLNKNILNKNTKSKNVKNKYL